MDKFEIFEKWLLDNGAKFPKLYLKDYGNEMRGCHSSTEIESDETIVDIPLKCLITVEMGKETEIGRIIMASDINLDAPKHIFIMLFMLIDRKQPDSFFKPYYDILPATLHNMPIFWSEDELAMLRGSYMLTQIEDRNIAIARDYAKICELVPSFVDVCNLEEFKWARMCVCSRNFGMIINDVRTAALVPYADMLNHYRPRETKWQFEDSSQSFTVVSLQPIAHGAQVYDSYGQKCNHRFLLNYGFSVESNIELDGFCPNEVPFIVELTEEDDLYPAKALYWNREAMGPQRMIRVCVSDNDNTRVAFSLLRFIVADHEDLDLLLLSSDFRGDLVGNGDAGSRRNGAGIGGFRSLRNAQTPCSMKNEVQALERLRALCDYWLQQYPTSLWQDIDRLSTPGAVPMFTNERHALIQVKGEKEVLMFYREFSEISLGLFSVHLDADSAFSDQLNEIHITKHYLVYNYCRSVVQKLRNDEKRKLEIQRKTLNMALPTVV